MTDAAKRKAEADRKRKYRARKKGQTPPVHGLLGYRDYGCRCLVCKGAQATDALKYSNAPLHGPPTRDAELAMLIAAQARDMKWGHIAYPQGMAAGIMTVSLDKEDRLGRTLLDKLSNTLVYEDFDEEGY